MAKYQLQTTSLLQEPDASSPIQIYPNPVNDLLKIVQHDSSLLGNIEVYNTKGQRLFHEHNTVIDQFSIDTSTLDPGVYFIRLSTMNGLDTTFFIKN